MKIKRLYNYNLGLHWVFVTEACGIFLDRDCKIKIHNLRKHGVIISFALNNKTVGYIYRSVNGKYLMDDSLKEYFFQ